MAHGARVGIEYHQQPVALAHGGCHTVLQAGIVLLRGDQFVHHHFYVMVLVAVYLHARQGFAHLAVHPDVEVTFLPHLLEQFLVMPLAVAHQRRQDVDALASIFLQDKLQDLLLGVLHHLLAGQVGVGHPGTGVQQAEEVVNLRRGAHRGTRVLVRGLLLDGDDRTEPRDFIHVGTLQVSQKVARIGRESLDITALPFGKNGIERQR